MSTLVEASRRAASDVKGFITPEEMLLLRDEGRGYDLIDGNLVERNMGRESCRAGSQFTAFLSIYANATGLGWVYGSDMGFRCFPSRNTVRFADAAFVSLKRSPLETYDDTGYCEIPPEVVVEAFSIHDRQSELLEKVDAWLSAGAIVVWVPYPLREIVHEHRQGREIRVLNSADLIAAEDVLPGFSLKVEELYRKPGQRPTAPSPNGH